jgi:hypothetical protein
MPEPIGPVRRSRRGLLIWAVAATLAAIVFGNIALLLLMKLGEANARLAQANPPLRGVVMSRRSMVNVNSPFAALQESDVAAVIT